MTASSELGGASSANPVCLLTGAGGRLGMAFCRQFASQYQVVAVGRSRLPSATLRREYLFDPVAPHERRECTLPRLEMLADLTVPGEAERVVQSTLAELGRIDVLVNAAGMAIWGQVVDRRVVETAEEQLSLLALVPLRLAAEVARLSWASRPEDNRRHNRSIVNISSSAGIYVYPDCGQTVYGAAKAALNHITCHLAHEFALFGIRVNALAPEAFPYIVPTEVVAAQIVALAQGGMTGAIVSLPTGDAQEQ